MVLVVMTMVVMMMPLMVGNDAIDGDVVGDDDDGGGSVGTRPFISANSPKFSKYIFFTTGPISPCLDTLSDYLQ